MFSKSTHMLGLFGFFLCLLEPSLSQDAANAPCPNSCSGHGHCDSSNVHQTQCECYDGFTGADCSLMTCPYGPAWTDFATATDTAHNLAECSNRGICDREKGTCLCEAGRFEGRACERKTCPNSCNGKGVCASMKSKAAGRNPGDLISACSSTMVCVDSSCASRDYDQCQSVHAYDAVWDAEMMFGCICDEGWYGPDCTLRHCPSGDDPYTGMGTDTVNGVQVNEKQIVTCTANGGTFTLEFEGETTDAIAYDATLSQFVAALEALTTITNDFSTAIVASYTGTNTKACTDSGNAITIEFYQNFGKQPLILPNGDSLTHSSSIFEPLITSSQSIVGTKENTACSTRGICDVSTGTCTCATSFDTSNGYGAAGQRGDCGYVTTTITDCPGEVSCNGVGVCAGPPTYVCECSNGYTGADCTQMVCPTGRSWFDYPTAANSAHYSYTECSDAGVCDTEAGVCECMDGFEGSACQRMSCPGDPVCNDHGTCLSMSGLALIAENNGDATDFKYGAVPNLAATWDFDMIYGCSCDEGYEGYDCSLLSCPYGDDPLSTFEQYNEVQKMVCDESTGTDGTFILSFRQESTVSLGHGSFVADVEVALETLQGITDVHVYLDDDTADATTTPVCGSGGTAWYVEFYSPTSDVPMITVTAENLDDFAITEFKKGNKEWAECSLRGVCDHETGLCACVNGFASSDGQGNSGMLADCGYKLPIVVSEE